MEKVCVYLPGIICLSRHGDLTMLSSVVPLSIVT